MGAGDAHRAASTLTTALFPVPAAGHAREAIDISDAFSTMNDEPQSYVGSTGYFTLLSIWTCLID